MLMCLLPTSSIVMAVGGADGAACAYVYVHGDMHV